MRITFVTPPFDLSGGQRVVAVYADRLRRRGHTTRVVAPVFPRPTLWEVVRSLVKSGRLPAHTVGSHVVDMGVDYTELGHCGPVREADLPDADAVVATWWETAEWVAALSPAKGAKVYFLQHHELFDYLPVDRVKATWRLPLKKVVISRWLQDLARDEYGDPDAALVPNAVDTDLFHAPPRGKQPHPTVGLMYSMHPSKGCAASLEAVARARRAVPGLRLVAFGVDEIDPRLPLPDGTGYHRRPAQHTLRDVYAGCDAWLFGSRTEGFGLPILEAMACRTPVIGTPAGAAPELLAGGGGVLVRPDDPEDMAAAITRLCRTTEPDWRAVSDAAHATATRYTWEAAAARFEQALLAAGRPTRREPTCPPT